VSVFAKKRAVLIIFANLMLLALDTPAQGPPVTLSPTGLSFGNVALGSSLAKKVTLTNNQSVALSISPPPAINGESDFAVAGGTCQGKLAAHASCTYILAFTPTVLSNQNATVEVNDNASNTPQQANLNGTGSAAATFSPASVSFPSQLITTTSAAKTVTLSNNQDVALSIAPPAVKGDFALAGGTCGPSLAAFSKCTYLVTFTPPSLETFAGALTINADLSSGPLVVNLAGTGGTAGIASVSVAPTSATVLTGTSQQFTATANLSAGGTIPITSIAHWSSSNTKVATVNTTGLASLLEAGTASIKASLNSSLNTSATLMAVPALVSIAVTPQNSSLPLGTSQQFVATGSYSNGSTQNLTNAAVWSSSASTVANIGNGGLAVSAAQGTAMISASLGSVVGSTKLTVTAPAVVSISLTPANFAIPAGASLQVSAFGTYTNGSTQQVTSSLSWMSSNTAVATVAGGLVTGATAGSTTISATSGSATGSATLTVSPASLQTIAISPMNSSIAVGDSVALTATGMNSDGSSVDLTTAATWTSSDNASAVVGSTGLANGIAPGFATLTAMANGVSGSTVLSVTQTGTTLQSITVSPAGSDLEVGDGQQFTATGNFSDGSRRDLTSAATWYVNQINARYPASPSFAQYGVPSSLITGVLVELNWNQVDMGPGAPGGQYQWSAFDSSIAAYISSGKSVDLIVWAQNYPGYPSTLPAYVQAFTTNVVPGCSGYNTWIAPPYSPDFLAAYKSFVAAVVEHYANNPAISYMRVGLSAGGEVYRYCGATLDNYPAPPYYAGSPFNCSTASDVGQCVWLAYDQDMLNYLQSQNPATPILSPSTSQNQAGSDTNNVYPTTEAQQAVTDGFGFGVQGFQKSDLTNYANGLPCTANWCADFATYAGQVSLELQTLGQSDPVCTSIESICANTTGSLLDLLPFAVSRYASILEIYENDFYIALDPLNPDYAMYSSQYTSALETALQSNLLISVDASGMVTANSAGSTTVFAQYGAVAGSATLNVTASASTLPRHK
jgi:hypothetical protein